MKYLVEIIKEIDLVTDAYCLLLQIVITNALKFVNLTV